MAATMAVVAVPAMGPALEAQRVGPPGGGPGGAQVKLVEQFDENDDGWLNATERQAAREFLAAQPATGRGGPGGRGGRGGRGGPGGGGLTEPGTPGPALTQADVTTYADEPVYAPNVLRTFFIQFENTEWEAELAAFYNTDVEVPATVTVDGRVFRDVGVHFRGASSFFTVPAGRKRSMNLSFDFVHDNQALGGYRTFNLLNSHTDPTMLRSALYLHIVREYIPAPKANYVRVVINGESWGPYVNAQQFNKDFTRDFYGTTSGARWKVPGRPNGRGGLEYLGDDPAAYRALYEIKSKDDDAAWTALIELCRVLNGTPPDRLEAALGPLLDIDGTLAFLALENVFVNGDGYWTRASDYGLYRDTDGRFHVTPHDANETISAGRGGGPGRPGGPGRAGRPGGPPPAGRGRGVGQGSGGTSLDPLVAADDPTKPLLSKLLAVPALRARYLALVREIAGTWLDWDRLEPLVTRYQAVIADDVSRDTRALDSYDAFTAGVADLRRFVEARRLFLSGQ